MPPLKQEAWSPPEVGRLAAQHSPRAPEVRGPRTQAVGAPGGTGGSVCKAYIFYNFLLYSLWFTMVARKLDQFCFTCQIKQMSK